MSIDKKGFRYRLSNVLAWGGFGCFLWGCHGYSSDGFTDWIAMGAFVWVFFGVINYLMVGSLRLIPWRDIEDQE